MEWDEQAEKELQTLVPAPFRPIARKKVEGIAKERGSDKVTMNEVAIAKAKYMSGEL